MIYPIVKYPNPILRKKNVLVKHFDDELKTLIQNMFKTMLQADGIGLAAPQIGKNIRLFIVNTKDLLTDTDDFQVFINPVITFTSQETAIDEEGCLSIPKIYTPVKRHVSVIIKAQDVNGKEFVQKADKLLARIIQHEFDHLNGVLFIDKVLALNKKTLEFDLKKRSKDDA